MQTLAEATRLIGTQLKQVETELAKQKNHLHPDVRKYVGYTCGLPGKRLRPMLVFLSAGATGTISRQHVTLAVALELIHIASLVHDDIIDSADSRRGKPTPNSKWGNRISVSVGDLLLAHSMRVACNIPNPEVVRKISEASAAVCLGEVAQTQRCWDTNLDKSEYIRIIESKTGALFSAASGLGAELAGAAPSTVLALQRFGSGLGIAYQIYDDCLDIVGSEQKLGKTLGTDMKKGKFTLPVIELLSKFRNIHAFDDPAKLVQLLLETGSFTASVKEASVQINTALEQLNCLDRSPYRLSLQQVGEYLQRRIADLETP